MLISGFFLLPISTVFAVYSEGGEILNIAEDALKDEGLEALRNQISQLDIPPIEGQQSKNEFIQFFEKFIRLLMFLYHSCFSCNNFIYNFGFCCE